MKKRFQQQCLKAKNDLPIYLPHASLFLDKQGEASGYRHFFSEYKLMELAWHIERIQPKCILELGGGSTTAVFADYVLKHPDVTVLSIDNSQRYLDETKNRLDSDVRGAVTFRCFERKIERISGEDTCYYSPSLHQQFKGHIIDLCYVDGPFNQLENSKKLMPCIDSIKLLEAGAIVRHFLFDYRFSSVQFFCKSAFGLKYDKKLHHNAFYKNELIWNVFPVRYHSFLSLRSGIEINEKLDP